MESEIENLVIKKISPIQKKIEHLQNSIQEKDEELVTLKYALDSLMSHFTNLKQKRRNIPLEIKLMTIFKRLFINDFLEKIKNESFFSFFDFQSLLKMRLVCKKWDTFICNFFLNIYDSSSLSKNEENREKILSEIDDFTTKMKNLINNIEVSDISMLKAFKNPPTLVVKGFNALFMVLGHIKPNNVDSWEFVRGHILDMNLLNNVLTKSVVPSLPKWKLENLKRYLQENQDLTEEHAQMCSRCMAVFLNLTLLKIKFEEYLDENFGEFKVLLSSKGFWKLITRIQSRQAQKKN